MMESYTQGTGAEGPKAIRVSNRTGAMRVALISQTGTIQTIWLPDNMEGRYRFPDSQEETVPLYMESRNGQWVAHLEKGAAFHSGDDRKITEFPLSDEQILKIRFLKREYVLYTEITFPEHSSFLPYYWEEGADYTIGRNPDSQIYYPNKTVSWKHAQLHWEQGGWTLLDCGSRNGTYLNGALVRSARLAVGDEIYIMGLYILIGPGVVCINNSSQRILLNTPKIHRIFSRQDVRYPPCPPCLPREGIFDRQPRKKTDINPAAIHIEPPPMPLSGNKVPLLLRMGSPMVMGGRALVTGNYLMALTSLVFPAMTQGLTEKDRKEYEEKRIAGYRQYLADKQREIAREKADEETLLNQWYPDLAGTLRFAVNKDRLWERRSVDKDFLHVRIGIGQIPLLAERDFSKREFELEEDFLKKEMYTLAEKPVLLENVPITLSLKEDYITGVLGFSRSGLELIRNLIMQLVLTHSYDEVKLVLLADSRYTGELSFVRYLPHCWNDDRSIRFFASNRSDAMQISEYLSKEIETLVSAESRNHASRNHAAYVVVALSKELFDCVESFKEILGQEEYKGVSIIAAFDGIPKECSKIIDLRGEPKLISLAADGGEDQRFALDRFHQEEAQWAMNELMHTRLMTGSREYSLPGMITFLEMFGAGKVEHLNPLRRWAENNPVKSLSVPIGVGTDGRLFSLDLHQDRQGPHGLVAGMTGSGKSEFLITYILSLAVNFSADEVAFVLIDYKGGGLADAFENKEQGIHLPHLVGTITNLDGASIDRSLMSIKSELTRRQTIFKEVKQRSGEGTLDIYDYQKLYRNKQVNEPLPHLFIISDEFAELKQQQPMFMDELISAARIGRSLGIHLILATQKPGGVVNNQIWSNTKFRACLRVQDRSDSMEMLKRPEAAELKHTGRFYLQVGYNEYFALGQSAWCGADYIPQDEVIEERDDSVQFLDNAGKTVLSVRPKTEKQQAESRQIVAVVKYLSDLAKRENIMPRSLWTEPLPKKLELAELLESTPIPKGGVTALAGMVDDPEFQRQFPLFLDLLDIHNLLVIGNAGSGKSTLVRTLLFSLVSRYSSEEIHYYILDYSDGALRGYSGMPHCGAYLTEQQASERGRLMDMISDIVRQRKALFAEAEVNSFEAYRKLHPLPVILVILDGFTKVKGLTGGDRFFMQFPDYLREGGSYGIRYIVTCNHMNEVGSQSRPEMDGRIALQAKDKYEYSDILLTQCKIVPPEINGRGVCVQDGRPLVYQAAMLDCGAEESDRAALLRKRLQKIAGRDAGLSRAKRLPMIDYEQPYEDFCRCFQQGRIPLGYALRDMKPVSIPLQQLHSMSLYFGNPKGVQPVLQNLLCAARMNGMNTIFVRRLTETVIDEAHDSCVTLLECTPEDLVRLADVILTEIAARNVLRDAFCTQEGIPPAAKGRAKKASKYIRAHSRPLMVVFESFVDFCKVEAEFSKTNKDEEKDIEGRFTVYFNQMYGYNIYFAAGFYPGDESLPKHPLMELYNKEEFTLLYGGRYDKAVIKSIPYDIRRNDKMEQAYNQMLMKYQDEIYPLLMPCGKLQEEVVDPDEVPIV